MPERKFLEDNPLYSKIGIASAITMNQIPKPAVHMFCEECKSDQTFQMINQYDWYGHEYADCPQEFEAMCLYQCAACNNERTFLLHFETRGNEFIVTKTGQYPPWSISISRDLANALDGYEEIYKRGLICESQGYGIGAFAYYRRIIEGVIDNMLDMIPDLLSGNDKESYLIALKQTKHDINASNKIELVKELLPSSLRPGGINPLSTLHSSLSEGLHAKTDEECIELATNIRLVLTYLIEQITFARKSSANFTEGMKKLLEKRSKKI